MITHDTRNLLMRKYGKHGNYLHAIANGYAEVFCILYACSLCGPFAALHT